MVFKVFRAFGMINDPIPQKLQKLHPEKLPAHETKELQHPALRSRCFRDSHQRETEQNGDAGARHAGVVPGGLHSGVQPESKLSKLRIRVTHVTVF